MSVFPARNVPEQIAVELQRRIMQRDEISLGRSHPTHVGVIR
jgi:hypothetical protein